MESIYDTIFVLKIPQWPQKTTFCGHHPTSVTNTTSCLSSAYQYSYHNTLLVLSRPLYPKSLFLWSSAYPCSQQRSQVVLSIPHEASQHSVYPPPNPVSTNSQICGPQPTPIATTASLVVLSLSLKQSQYSLCHTPTQEATKASWWASVYP